MTDYDIIRLLADAHHITRFLAAIAAAFNFLK
jgi:hypothetical protein